MANIENKSRFRNTRSKQNLWWPLIIEYLREHIGFFARPNCMCYPRLYTITQAKHIDTVTHQVITFNRVNNTYRRLAMKDATACFERLWYYRCLLISAMKTFLVNRMNETTSKSSPNSIINMNKFRAMSSRQETKNRQITTKMRG